MFVKRSHTMKKYILLSVIAVFCTFTACDNRGKDKEIERLAAERDSLITITQKQDSVQLMMDNYIETLASTMDSIRVQEKILTLKTDENGRPLKRQQIRENLLLLSEVIHRQRQRIEELEAKLIGRGQDSTSNYRTVISHLYEEIDAKNAEIARMEKELNQKNVMISQLNSRVSSLEQDVETISSRAREQEQMLSEQAEILTVQNNQINTGYVKIATRKTLMNEGFLKKGLFSGGGLETDGLNMASFDVVDIREFHEVKLSSARPKLLTAHPTSSYSIKKDTESNNSSYLVITDPAAFWSISNYLVVQL